MNALHDVAELQNRIGGPDRFIDRLDKLFDLEIFDVGNEPGFVSPFLYNFAKGAQWKSVMRSRFVSSKYNAGGEGITGKFRCWSHGEQSFGKC